MEEWREGERKSCVPCSPNIRVDLECLQSILEITLCHYFSLEKSCKDKASKLTLDDVRCLLSSLSKSDIEERWGKA